VTITDVFEITGRGSIIVIDEIVGQLHIGDEIEVKNPGGTALHGRVTGIEYPGRPINLDVPRPRPGLLVKLDGQAECGATVSLRLPMPSGKAPAL